MFPGYKDIFGLLSYVMKCMKIWLTPSPLRGSGIMELGGEKLSNGIIPFTNLAINTRSPTWMPLILSAFKVHCDVGNR